MHQGNLFVDTVNIIPVDFGIMGRLDDANRKYLVEILYGFINRLEKWLMFILLQV